MAIKIRDIEIGERTLIIAEIGNNHKGDFNLAERLIREAAAAGAAAVKFQTFQAKHLVTNTMPVMVVAKGIHKTQRDRMESLQFSLAQWQKLKDLSDEVGLIFLSTPFDEESVDLLESMVSAFKISSGDLNNLPLVRHIVTKKKPLIVSTGMADIVEIESTLNIIPKDRVVLLHCVSLYPTPMEKANLLSIPFLQKQFNVPVGYSDHTIGITACMAAAALGAVVLEKHFTLDKTDPIGDHKLSADPKDLRQLCENVRQIEKARGVYAKPTDADRESRKTMRRSIYSAHDISAGEIITLESLVYLRPPEGLPPRKVDQLLGRKARVNIPQETPITYEMLEER